MSTGLLQCSHNGGAPQDAEDTMDRFSFTKTFRDLVALAVSLEIVDATRVLVLGATYGTDAEAILEDITETAYCMRHCGDQHSQWSKALNARAPKF